MKPEIVKEILAYIWAAFGLYWILSARRLHRTQTGEPHVYRLVRLSVLALTFILLFSNWLRIGPFAWRFVPNDLLIRETGVLISLIGIFLAIWARRHLGQYWSDKVEIKVDHQLIRSGPYAVMRHPIYSGVLLGVAGTALAIGEWRGVIAFCLLLTSYTVKAKKEDRVLSERFGEIFREHRSQAGFLFPRL
jgi:protein-S-isoprenylcysteine O-methyltransferase Ste14